MESLLLATLGINDLWYAAPLIVVVSLVYAATRHEAPGPILVQSLRIGIWIISFMAIVFVVLLLVRMLQ